MNAGLLLNKILGHHDAKVTIIFEAEDGKITSVTPNYIRVNKENVEIGFNERIHNSTISPKPSSSIKI